MTIVYAGETLMTGDEIADALLKYSAALAESGSASTVEIPTIRHDGTRATVKVLVGPASQIVASPVESSFEELRDDHVVSRLSAMTAELRPVRTYQPPASSADVPDWLEEL